MIERYFRQKSALMRVRVNPLGQGLEALAVFLNQRGYAPSIIRLYITAAAHFGTWLRQEGINQRSITERTVSSFLDGHLPQCQCPSPHAPRGKEARAALGHLLEALRHTGHIHSASPPQLKPIDREVDQFEAHLRTTCALAEDTIVYRVRYARDFLAATYGCQPPKLSDLTPEAVSDFVFAQARHLKPASVKVLATSLRSYLRFVSLRGRCRRDFSCAVPTVAAWKKAHIPRTLSPEQIERLLASFDRSTATGRRDYALCLCLADLGLRSSEVAHLCLEHLDWRAGTICIASGKTPRPRLLPLPKRVGRAISDYLRQGRPRSQARQVFLRHALPHGQPITRAMVAKAVARGWAHSAPGQPAIGPHVLRHSAASHMHERGATFKEIADVLGHQQLDTVSIYAKVNLVQLVRVAMPWLDPSPS